METEKEITVTIEWYSTAINILCKIVLGLSIIWTVALLYRNMRAAGIIVAVQLILVASAIMALIRLRKLFKKLVKISNQENLNT